MILLSKVICDIAVQFEHFEQILRRNNTITIQFIE